jgi:hypothetical protein
MSQVRRAASGSSYTWSHVLSQNTKSAPIREMSINKAQYFPDKQETLDQNFAPKEGNRISALVLNRIS